MRKIKLTKDDIKSMNPEDAAYYRDLAKTRKRAKRAKQARTAAKGAVYTGAAAVIYMIGQKSQTKQN